MEENMNQNMGQGCGCGCNRCSSGGSNGRWACGHRCFFPIRLILGLVILAIVFSVGVKMGEFKAMYGGYDYGYGMGGGNYMYRVITPQTMMNQGLQVQGLSGQPVPTNIKK